MMSNHAVKTKPVSLSSNLFLQKSDLLGRKNKDGTRTQGILPFSESTMLRLIEKGKFPKAIKISDRRIVWSATAVQQWLNKYTQPQCANSSEFEEAA